MTTKKPAAKKRAVKAAKASIAPVPVATKPAADKKVLVLRTCAANMESSNGFVWPESGPVECKDWQPTKECGNGLHGWLWGAGDWSMKANGEDIWWLVVECSESEVIDIGGKVKFPRGTVVGRHSHWREAMTYIRAHLTLEANKAIATERGEVASATGDYGHASATGISGHASATGDSGHASATGISGHASATGNYGHASATGISGHASATGNYGHASATGDSGHASATGDYGHASATGISGHASATGDSGHASATGYYGHASATGYSGWGAAGYNGKAKANANGVISILWFCNKSKRPRLAVGYVGEDGIKPDTWYCVKDGKLTEVE